MARPRPWLLRSIRPPWAKGRKELQAGAEPPRPVLEPGRVLRVARLLALAHQFDGFLW
jgi:hypothetical protein